MDGVVDAVVHGSPAAEKAAVGGIDNGVDPEAGDVALPEHYRLGWRDYDAPFLQLGLEFAVLGLKEFAAEGLGLPDVHEGTEQAFLALEVLGKGEPLGGLV
jgi:hypothetical protein